MVKSKPRRVPRMVKSPFNLQKFEYGIFLSVINKMTPANFLRLKRSSKPISQQIDHLCKKIGVKFDKQLTITYDDNKRSRTHGKIIVKIAMNTAEGKTKQRFFKEPVLSNLLKFLSGFSFENVFIDINTINAKGLPATAAEEMKKALAFFKERKWRDHTVIIDETTPAEFLDTAGSKSAASNILPDVLHPNIQLMTLYPCESEAFESWETPSCQGLRYVKFDGTRMNATAIEKTFESLFTTWKKGAHGNVKIVEIANVDGCLENGAYGPFTTEKHLKPIAKAANLKGKPKYHAVDVKRLVRKSNWENYHTVRAKRLVKEGNWEEKQFAACRHDMTANGRNLVLASHRDSTRNTNDYGSSSTICLRAYLDYDGPIPLSDTPIDECMTLMTLEHSLAK